jgi:Nucleotidyl transferase AbiEii toxin, Type IV TA system
VADAADVKGRPPKLPGNTSHLQQLVSKHAAAEGMPPSRVQRWLNAMVVTAVLDRVRDENNEPIFLLKGGVAMELRLRLRARVTKDYDAAFRARAEDVLDKLDEAIAHPWNEFAITRSDPERVPSIKAIRVKLKLAYKGRSWGTVEVELAPVEGAMGSELDRVPAAPLDMLQVPVPAHAVCVSLRYQAAQKLHACTEVFQTGRDNDRFRDVMDILLVEEFLVDVGLARVREACIDIFTVRGKHTWPPAVTVYEGWRAPFTALARENGFTPDDIDEAAAELTEFIEAIDRAVLDVDSVRLESDAIAVASELSPKEARRFRDAFHEQHSQVELAHSPPAHIQLGDGVSDGTFWRFPIAVGSDALGPFVNERVVQAAHVALDHVRSAPVRRPGRLLPSDDQSRP